MYRFDVRPRTSRRFVDPVLCSFLWSDSDRHSDETNCDYGVDRFTLHSLKDSFIVSAHSSASGGENLDQYCHCILKSVSGHEDSLNLTLD